jgi:hypothetical protein
MMITRTWEVGTTVNYAPPCLAESEACRLFNHTVQPTKFQIGNTPGNLRSKNDDYFDYLTKKKKRRKKEQKKNKK